MPLNIKDNYTHELARELAHLTSESLTQAVKHAIEDKLTKIKKQNAQTRLADELDYIALYCANLQNSNNQTSDEIIGYDDIGLPS